MNSLSIFTTITKPIQRGDLLNEPMGCYEEIADEVITIDGRETWPDEFDWTAIGQHFQRGYEASTGDAVMRADLDFIFHEKDYQEIRNACDLMVQADWPAIAFEKRQIFTPDRYNLKSRIVIAVNKVRYGDRIKFDSGGDLCQVSLDGKLINPWTVGDARIPIWNYECILKTKQQIMADKGRFARAWQRTFGEYKLGGPDDESAYQAWWQMIKGRYTKHTNKLRPADHPKMMQDVIKKLRPDQFGYNAFGLKP